MSTAGLVRVVFRCSQLLLHGDKWRAIGQPNLVGGRGPRYCSVSPTNLKTDSNGSGGVVKSTMRESLGKGIVKVTPVAILPTPEESKPHLYNMGNKSIDYRTAKKEIEKKRKHAFTDENFIEDKFEFMNVGLPWEITDEMTASDLIKCLTKEVGISKKDANAYLTSAPSLLGVSLDEIKHRVKELKGLGFSRKQVASILPRFPSSLKIDWENVREVYLLLSEELKVSKPLVAGVMKQHPFIFMVDSSKVRECLTGLKTHLALHSTEITHLLNHAPMLAQIPLTKEAMHKLQQFLAYSSESSCIPPILLHSIFHRPSLVELTEETALLTQLLHSFKADPQLVLKKLPLFYQQDANKLRDIVELLSGKPLYLDPQDIAHLLEKEPDTLCSICDGKALEKHLDHLCRLFASPSAVRSKIRLVKGLIHPGCQVKKKYHVLIKRGFVTNHARSILTRFPTVLTQGQLVAKLELLMGIPRVNPSYLTQSPKYLSIPWDILSQRYLFASKYKPDLLVATRLEDLLCSNLETFAEFCGCDVETVVSSKAFTMDQITRPKTQRIPARVLSSPKETPSSRTAANLAIKEKSSAMVCMATTDTSATTAMLSPQLNRSPPLVLQKLPQHETVPISVVSTGFRETISSPSSQDCSGIMSEVPFVLDPSLVLSSNECDVTSSEIEPFLTAEDQPMEDNFESDVDVEIDSNLDEYVDRELEDLMAKLSKASSAKYRLSSCNQVVDEDMDSMYGVPVVQPSGL